MPRSRSACMTPMAIRSLAAKIAVGCVAAGQHRLGGAGAADLAEFLVDDDVRRAAGLGERGAIAFDAHALRAAAAGDHGDAPVAAADEITA